MVEYNNAKLDMVRNNIREASEVGWIISLPGNDDLSNKQSICSSPTESLKALFNITNKFVDESTALLYLLNLSHQTRARVLDSILSSQIVFLGDNRERKPDDEVMQCVDDMIVGLDGALMEVWKLLSGGTLRRFKASPAFVEYIASV